MKYKREFLGEVIGTFILVLFGCGSVAVSILFDSYQGILQIAIVWGIAVSLAIYMTRYLSCAHLNPAVTLAMAVNRRMCWRRVPAYITAQFLGAFLAATVLYSMFSSSIRQYEAVNGIIRGTPESVKVARMFGEYYQQAGCKVTVSMPLAMLAEGFGTFLLVFLIFILSEGCNLGRPDSSLTPVFIGLSVSSVICLFAPLSQGGFNPARDFAPRLAAWLFGWKDAAFPDHAGGVFYVYILSPIVGGQLAGFFFTHVIQKFMQQKVEACNCCKK